MNTRKTGPTRKEGNSKKTEVRKFKRLNSESEYLLHERKAGKVHECSSMLAAPSRKTASMGNRVLDYELEWV